MKSRIITLLFCILGFCVSYAGKSTTPSPQTTPEELLSRIRRFFNTAEEDSFYQASADFRAYYLSQGDMRQYYKGFENEILYDLNFNHFYRAMKKATAMQEDMTARKCVDQYFKATYLVGMIYSLKGNTATAMEYFQKAIEEAGTSNPRNLINIYMDMANIEMEDEPEKALGHLDKAIDIITDSNDMFEYSDAIGFKTIIAFYMRDWQLLDESYRLYRQLEKDHPQDFSTTYYNYVMICKLARDGQYQRAINFTNRLTNAGDQYKFQLDVYKVAGDTANILKAFERYHAVNDSINNVIMSEELLGAAEDLEFAKMQHKAERAKLMERALIITAVLATVIIGLLALGFLARRKTMRRLEAKNRELTIARDKAEESEQMKKQFLNNMSHEIRTPLNIISGLAQVVSTPGYNPSDDERAEISMSIQKSSNSIVRIVDELLDISNKESVSHVELGERVACNELCREAVSNCAMPFDHQVKLSFESSLPDDFTIATNRELLQKVLSSLLGNACKFTTAGAITLRATQSAKQLEISVTDTGCGIAESEREHIFNHFYKSDRYKEGLGLGLPLARRCARQLGGDVVLDTTYTEGARFVVTLPLS